MRDANPQRYKAIFRGVVRPEPYIPYEKVPELAEPFKAPGYCMEFIRTCERGEEDVLSLMVMLERTNHPAARELFKNLLTYGHAHGSPLKPFESDMAITAMMMNALDVQDRKRLLGKTGMIADLVDNNEGRRYDRLVLDELEQSTPQERGRILAADFAVDHLLNFGRPDFRAYSRDKVVQWFEEQPDEDRRRIMRARYAAQGFLKAFGVDGVNTVNTYLDQSERAKVISPQNRRLFYNFTEETVRAYLASLSDEDRAKFFDPAVISDVRGGETMTGPEIKEFYDRPGLG